MREQYEEFSKIIADVAGEIGVTVPANDVLNSVDVNARQLSRAAVDTCDDLMTTFPWRSKLGTDPWVKSNDGTYKRHIERDDDMPLFDARVIKLGTRWRYLHSKGLKYGEDFRAYRKRIGTFAYYHNKGRVIDTNRGGGGRRPT